MATLGLRAGKPVCSNVADSCLWFLYRRYVCGQNQPALVSCEFSLWPWCESPTLCNYLVTQHVFRRAVFTFLICFVQVLHLLKANQAGLTGWLFVMHCTQATLGDTLRTKYNITISWTGSIYRIVWTGLTGTNLLNYTVPRWCSHTGVQGLLLACGVWMSSLLTSLKHLKVR